MSCREPILILSDLHLSHEEAWRERIGQLRPLWRGMGTVVLNGDTLCWTTALEEGHRREVLGELERCTAEDGVELVTLAGNSDHTVTHRRHLHLGDETILVMHGDAVFDQISPWRRSSQHLGRFRGQELERQPRDRRVTLHGQLHSVQSAMLRHERLCRREQRSGKLLYSTALLPRVVGQVRGLLTLHRVWREFPARCAAFAGVYAPKTTVVVIGHFHKSGVWRVGKRTIVNTGHFGRWSRPLAAVVERGQVSVHGLRLRGGRWGFVRGEWPVVRC